VARLHYRRVAVGTQLLKEGEPGSTLLIIASGQVAIDKGGSRLATVGAGTVFTAGSGWITLVLG
jgi:hypothetical protein